MMMSQDCATDLPSSEMAKIDFRASLYLYQNVGKHIPSWLLVLCEHSGNGFFWIFGVLLLALLPSLDWKVRIIAINLEVGFLLDLAVIGAVKLLVRRARPSYPDKQYTATIIADKYSFPSGHASRSIFIAAMVVVFRSVCHSFLVVLAVLWAIGTTLSRVFLGRHYVADVAVGSAIGILIAGVLSKVCSSSPRPLSGRRSPRIQVTALVLSRTLCVTPLCENAQDHELIVMAIKGRVIMQTDEEIPCVRLFARLVLRTGQSLLIRTCWSSSVLCRGLVAHCIKCTMPMQGHFSASHLIIKGSLFPAPFQQAWMQ